MDVRYVYSLGGGGCFFIIFILMSGNIDCKRMGLAGGSDRKRDTEHKRHTFATECECERERE